MEYTLYGSKTSPFVRRIRMLMADIPYQFQEMDIFSEAQKLNAINPVNQIPVLTSGELTIWDSRQIFNYLNQLHRFQNMDWEDENMLTAIDGAMDSAVTLLLMRRSGFDVTGEQMYLTRQRDRIESVLDYLKPYLAGPALQSWNFHTISLYCFLDWATFRQLISLEQRPECRQLLETYAELAIVKQTQIPKA
jgi:glutathione S-transferase